MTSSFRARCIAVFLVGVAVFGIHFSIANASSRNSRRCCVVPFQTPCAGGAIQLAQVPGNAISPASATAATNKPDVPVPSPIEFYRSLANSIKSAEGIGVANLNEGIHRTQVGSVKVDWTVADDTYADIRFDYQDKYLQHAKVKFNKSVHVKVHSNPVIEADITSIEYDFRGTATKIESKPDISSHLGTLRPHIQFDKNASAFFRGRSFKLFTNAAGKTLIHDISFFNRDKKPGLLVSLEDGVDLRFSSPQSAAYNWLRLGAPTTVQFDEVTYTVDESEVSGHLKKLECRLLGGSINGGDCHLQIAEGSKVIFEHADFAYRPQKGEAFVDASDGYLTASTKRGSSIVLSADKENPSEVVLDDGTSIELKGFRLEVNDKRVTRVSCANGSAFSLRVFDGRIALGTKSYVRIQNGSLDLSDTIAVWEGGKASDINGKVDALEFTVGGGKLDINSATSISLKGGKLKASKLAINTQHSPFLQGPINQAVLVFGESTIGVPGGFIVETKDGGEFAALDTLKITDQTAYPIGKYRFKVPIARFSNHKNASFLLTGGDAVLPLENHPEGKVTSPLTKDSAGAVVVANADRISLTDTTLSFKQGTDKEIKARVSVSEGQILPDTPSRFDGKLTGEIQSARIFLASKSEGVPGGFDLDKDGKNNDDARLYSVRLNVTVESPTAKFGPVPFRLDRNTVNCTFSSMADFTLTIPVGEGEYKNRDKPEEGGKKDGDHRDCQELFRDKLFAGGTIHFYLDPKTYKFSSKVSVTMSGTDKEIILTEFDTAATISWRKDGGDLEQWVIPIAGFVLGGLPGALIGVAINEELKEKLEGMIGAKIVETIHSFRQNWRITGG